jgi:hypothetical protein
MLALAWAILSALTLGVSAGTKIWDGSFNSYANASDFDKCMCLCVLVRCLVTKQLLGSWASQVGSYQWVSLDAYTKATTRDFTEETSFSTSMEVRLPLVISMSPRATRTLL